MSHAAARSAIRDRIEVLPSGAALGAELRGIDLREADNSAFAAIHHAWLDHLVVLSVASLYPMTT